VDSAFISKRIPPDESPKKDETLVDIGRQVARDRFQLNKRKLRKLKLKLKKIIFLYKTTLDMDRKMDAIGYPDHYKI
jgi:hypothetical protein